MANKCNKTNNIAQYALLGCDARYIDRSLEADLIIQHPH